MAVHVNQVGYYPTEQKTAVLTKGTSYELCDARTGDVVFSGSLSSYKLDGASGDEASIADFSEFQAEGSYYIVNDEGEISCRFEIKKDLYSGLQRDVLKAFYFQRCGCELEEQYAGIFRHKPCHTKPVMELEDKSVKKIINGGWHDAGDYGRYSTAAACALGHMLYAYRMFPEQWKEELPIPESGNGVPDILNECRYELDWLINMQKEDGSVYHKLTSFCHAGFVIPEEDQADFFLYPVSTLAAADFAAVMALASRIYGKWDKDFSDQALKASIKAWDWLVYHPDLIFVNNPEGSNTGTYGDSSDNDERAWAAAELFVATGEKKYEEALLRYLEKQKDLTGFGWMEMTGFAGLAILFDEKQQAKEETSAIFRNAFLQESERLVSVSGQCVYETAMEMNDYVWGSNMVVASRAMLLAVSSLLTGNREYHRIAAAQMDYLLGKNALDTSYVTGHGEHAYAHPHNRPTVALGDSEVMPGWLSGGPNGHPSDPKAREVIPQGTPPMRCFVDAWECYSLNEITIYWNSLLVFMTAYMQERN